MTGNEFQKEALRTAAGMGVSGEISLDLFRGDGLLNGLMGLSGEAGECLDILKKAMFQGHELDVAHIAKELSDCAWYLAVSAHAIGYDLDTIFQINKDKLRKRYPNGFESERSIHRQEGDI